MASEVPEEAQALLVLRQWQEMPGLGIQLVPEHVETRPLYHPRSPGLLQVREGSGPNSRSPGLTPRPGSQEPCSPRPPPGRYAAASHPAPQPSPLQSWTSILDLRPSRLTLVLQDFHPWATKAQTWHSQLDTSSLGSGFQEHQILFLLSTSHF